MKRWTHNVFEWDPVEDWVKLATIFLVLMQTDQVVAEYVLISSDVIAIGEPFTDNNIKLIVSKSRLEQSTWIQKGETIIGEESMQNLDMDLV